MYYLDGYQTSLAKEIATALTTIGLPPGLSEDTLVERIAPTVTINETAERGQLSSSVALTLFNKYYKNQTLSPPLSPPLSSPLALAQAIARHLTETGTAKDYRLEVAPPGYLNYTLTDQAIDRLFCQVEETEERYGMWPSLQKKLLLEFVSANPTGKLHIGRARGAVVGMALSNILEAAGYEVTKEYYVNDGGNQLEVLLLSAILVAQQQELYQGCYQDAVDLVSRLPEDTRQQLATISLPTPPPGEDSERIAYLVEALNQALEQPVKRGLLRQIVDSNLALIKQDLKALGLVMDRYVFESELTTPEALTAYFHKHPELVYSDEDNTLWFRAKHYGDEKDRVLIRRNGIPTYFAFDLFYHLSKLEQGYHLLINLWGSDHHGYVSRVTQGLAAFSNSTPPLEVHLVQFVVLKNSEGILSSMSTREGTAVSLSELIEAIGSDVAKVYYLQRGMHQHIEFDLADAKTQSQQNPYYYMQYAHARMASILNQAAVRYPDSAPSATPSTPSSADQPAAITTLLTTRHERELIHQIARFPNIIYKSAVNRTPHLPLSYLQGAGCVLPPALPRTPYCG